MALEINITTGVKAAFDHFTYNKERSELTVSNTEFGTFQLTAPFKMIKVPDRVFDASLEIEKVLIFRNRYFGEKSIIKLKYRVDDKKLDCGFIFSLRGITQADDNVIGDSKSISLYASRALVNLLHNNSSLPAKLPDQNVSGEYQLQDFYDEDIVICIISKEQLGGYSKMFELSLLFQLNLIGFYLLNSNQNREFQPEFNKYQRDALSKILRPDSKGELTIKNLSAKIVNEPYFDLYVSSLMNNAQDYLAKFFLIYQSYEILIDYITKEEIATKVSAPGALDNKSGYAIKGMVMEIGDEGYRIEKLFGHYSSFPYESDSNLSL